MVNVLYGGRGGLTGTGSQGFTQDTDGVPGAAESGDQFGGAVSIHDINGNGYADLAAGAPGENGVEGANSRRRRGLVAAGTSDGHRDGRGVHLRTPHGRGAGRPGDLRRLAVVAGQAHA